MKKKRWRAKFGKGYYFINVLGEVQIDTDYHIAIDDIKYKCGNYFATEEEAETIANKIKAVLNGADVIEVALLGSNQK